MVGRSARDDGRVDRLTPRQLQVLGLLAEGRSNLAIANRLAITEKAVARHAAQNYDTLGLPPSLDDHRRVLAVVRFLDRRANGTLGQRAWPRVPFAQVGLSDLGSAFPSLASQ
jgi:DNA-binding NarL/FixJ family response regulator